MIGYIGSPPNCRPECVINPECTSNLACIREKCTDPCPGSCGFAAKCSVINHTPICVCPEGYTGDPFTSCTPKPPTRKLLTFPPTQVVVTKGIFFQLFSLLKLTLAIHRLVVLMRSATTEFVLAYPSTKETLTVVVDRNVF